MNYTSRKAGQSLFEDDDDDELETLIYAALAGSAVSGTGGTVDLAVGDTTGTNSNELGRNILLSLLLPGGGAILGYDIGKSLAGDSLKDRLSVITNPPTASAKDHKAELKRIMLEEGETAAKQYFADKKNVDPKEAVKQKLKDMKKIGNQRRMAGAFAGAGLGAALALGTMVDKEY